MGRADTRRGKPGFLLSLTPVLSGAKAESPTVTLTPSPRASATASASLFTSPCDLMARMGCLDPGVSESTLYQNHGTRKAIY